MLHLENDTEKNISFHLLGKGCIYASKTTRILTAETKITLLFIKQFLKFLQAAI
jgi:hypothetical protein